MCWFKSSRDNKLNAQHEQEIQELQNHYERKLAAQGVIIADLKNKVTYHDEQDKSFRSRWQQLIERERKVEEREQLAEGLADSLVAEREYELELRERNLEETIARKVAAGIRGKEVGINKNWEYLFRKENKLNEYEQKILNRAQQIADHLGVPIRRILTPREKKLVDRSANELMGDYSALTEDHYALIDRVLSCPEDQLKDLLASTQQFQRNLRR